MKAKLGDKKLSVLKEQVFTFMPGESVWGVKATTDRAPCPECEGEGEVEHIYNSGKTSSIVCPICDGGGEVYPVRYITFSTVVKNIVILEGGKFYCNTVHKTEGNLIYKTEAEAKARCSEVNAIVKERIARV